MHNFRCTISNIFPLTTFLYPLSGDPVFFLSQLLISYVVTEDPEAMDNGLRFLCLHLEKEKKKQTIKKRKKNQNEKDTFFNVKQQVKNWVNDKMDGNR